MGHIGNSQTDGEITAKGATPQRKQHRKGNNVFKGISNLISELLEIELDISFIYTQLKIKGTVEATTGYNGFTPSDYADELYRDAKVNSQRKQRLQRRLDNLEKEQQQNLKHQMKQRIFKAGIEYYEARAEYCYYLAESAYEREYKIWTDIMLDFMAELDRQTENKTESPM